MAEEENGNCADYTGLKTNRSGAGEKCRVKYTGGNYPAGYTNLQTAIFQVNAEGVCVYASDPACRMLGVVPGQCASSWIMAVHPEDRDAVVEEWQTCFKNRKVFMEEFSLAGEQSGPARVIGQAAPIFGPDEEFNGYVAYFTDIAESKLYREELQLSHDHFIRVFNSMPVPMAISTLEEGLYTAVNDSFSGLLGYSRQEVLGSTSIGLGIWVNPGDRERAISKLLRDEKFKNFETYIRTKSGRQLFGIFSAEVISIGGRKFILSIFSDITERKRMENYLRETGEIYRTLFETTGTATQIVEEDTTISLVNAGTENLSGYSKHEIEGKKKITEFVHRDDLEEVVKNHKLRRINPEAVPRSYELRCVDRFGNTKYCIITSSIIPGTGKSVVSLMDITDKRMFKNEIDRLEMINTIGKMADGIGSEIKNTINEVRGFLQSINSKEEYTGYGGQFSFMVKELGRASLIMTEFLSLASVQTTDKRMACLNAIVDALLPLITCHVKRENIEIVVKAEDIPWLWLDQNEIKLLVLIIVRSCMEAVERGGRITINTRAEGREVTLAVKGQGTGRYLNALEKRDTPLFSNQDSYTGLGIAVCYGIAERNGACLEIATGPEGASYNIKFSLDSKAERVNGVENTHNT